MSTDSEKTDLTARITCTPETRDRVRALKQGTERYDDVLQRLIQVYEENADESHQQPLSSALNRITRNRAPYQK